MRKVIFLDRDGVINEERGEHTFRQQDFRFVEGLFESLTNFVARGYELIIITNQSGIAKGLYTHKGLAELHAWMLAEFTKQRLPVLEVFYCPHYDESGRCICRKPNSNMLERAIAKYKIDASKSYMIGDSQRDVEAAEKAGVKAIKIEPNSSLRLIKDLIAL
ncbi:MAG: HAD family hydrolase [Flavobacteriales bacterium]|nr:HAD family hydrolase [Flavobacteriales bacterium]